MLYSHHFDKTDFIDFQVYHRNEKNQFESSYGLGGRHLKIRDVCMDLEPCFKVHKMAVIQLKNTKLGQMTNVKVVFHMVVLFYKFDKMGNSTQSPAQPQSGHYSDNAQITSKRGKNKDVGYEPYKRVA